MEPGAEEAPTPRAQFERDGFYVFRAPPVVPWGRVFSRERQIRMTDAGIRLAMQMRSREPE